MTMLYEVGFKRNYKTPDIQNNDKENKQISRTTKLSTLLLPSVSHQSQLCPSLWDKVWHIT